MVNILLATNQSFNQSQTLFFAVFLLFCNPIYTISRISKEENIASPFPCNADDFLEHVDKTCFSYTSPSGIITIYKRITAQSSRIYSQHIATPLFIDIVDIYQSGVEVKTKCEDYVRDVMIGVSIDGIPIYSAFRNGYDIVSVGLRTGSMKIDKCGGTYGLTPDGIRYHYLVMPACVRNTTHIDDRWSSNISQVSDLFHSSDNISGIVGYTLTGYPIYRPQQEHNTDLDRCNGMFDRNFNFGYVATPTFPYLIGCSQRGTFSPSDSKLPLSIRSVCGSCPQGFYVEIEGDVCTPCPAGRYASVLPHHRQSGGMLSYCNNVASPGYFAPAGSYNQTKCPGGR